MAKKKRATPERVPAELDLELDLVLDEVEKYLLRSKYHIRIAGRAARPRKKFIDQCRAYAATVLEERAHFYFDLFMRELIVTVGIESLRVNEERTFKAAGLPWDGRGQDAARFRSIAKRVHKQIAALKKAGPLAAKKGRRPRQAESVKAIREKVRALADELKLEKRKRRDRYGDEFVIPEIASKLNMSKGAVDALLYERSRANKKTRD